MHILRSRLEVFQLIPKLSFRISRAHNLAQVHSVTGKACIAVWWVLMSGLVLQPNIKRCAVKKLCGFTLGIGVAALHQKLYCQEIVGVAFGD